MAEQFDIIIIGSGPGGYVAAIRAAQVGLKTAIIEKDKKFGGTCLHRGCIPTKALLHAAYLYEQTKHLDEFGILADNIKLDVPKLQSKKDRIVKKLSMGVEFLLKKNKVQQFFGYGRIKSATEVEVTGDDKKSQILKTKNIILATGSEPRWLPNLVPDGKGIITNNEALALDKVPKSMLIVGAGAIGVEFASIYVSFGTEISLVEVLPNILPIEDEEISKELAKIFAKRGISVSTNTKVESVTTTKGGYEAKISKEGKVEVKTFEKILVAVGRKPNTENIGLENTRIKTTKGFIEVNQFMQTAEPTIYAIGDIVPTPQLAHVASAEGILAVEKIKGLNTPPINYDRIPSCTYCDPQVASVGLSEKKALERGHKIKVGKFPFTASSKASILDEGEGFVKIIADEKYGEILGVHILHAHSTEMISEAVAVLNGELAAEDLAHSIHPHPTLSEAIAEATHAIYGHAIHI
ncbi:dihydrolipoyl dehydrogenase [Candidatus Peregrinibacteria bacterium]|nr:dihydrolipoyl dehydrogenase [Candidatus Peregrinibacteria bacterium]